MIDVKLNSILKQNIYNNLLNMIIYKYNSVNLLLKYIYFRKLIIYIYIFIYIYIYIYIY